MGRLVGKSWKLNQALDPGTNPEAVETIIRRIDDYCLGYKLPGAGGGGYLYMVAKDPEAAIRIRSILTQNQPNSCARFVDMASYKSRACPFIPPSINKCSVELRNMLRTISAKIPLAVRVIPV